MSRYRVGDRVRIDLPDELDPDFEYHGKHGIIIDATDARRGLVYQVGLEQVPITMEVTSREVRPPFLEEQEFVTDNPKLGLER